MNRLSQAGAAILPLHLRVRELSDRLVEALRPIRVLDAVKWDDGIEDDFFASNCRELPRVTRDYYASRSLGFDPERKAEEFRVLERDVRSRLGSDHAAGRILARRCAEGQATVDLISRRGSSPFSTLSRRLYGSSADCFRLGGPPLAHLGRCLSAILDGRPRGIVDEPEVSAGDAVQMLSHRLTHFFKDVSQVRIRLSDGIVADAVAGVDYIKVREDARFTQREVRLLEVHEGWVHLGTTLNGQSQPVCTFLTRCTPATTVTQEGLAVYTEVLAGATHPARVRRLTHRIEAVEKAEAGANFLEVFRFYLDHGYEPREGYQHTMRVFRGSLPEGCGPFTKDLAYGKGFVMVSEFVRTLARLGRISLMPLLFCGKTSIEDVDDLTQLLEEGMIRPPVHLPPPFSDIDELSARLRRTRPLTSRTGPSVHQSS